MAEEKMKIEKLAAKWLKAKIIPVAAGVMKRWKRNNENINGVIEEIYERNIS